MQKITVVILSFTILFHSLNFEIQDVSKVSALVNHITYHFKAGDSVADFFSMHYGSELSSHKNKHKEHQKLPFKHQHFETQAQFVYLISLENTAISFKPFTLNKNKFAYKSSMQNLFINSILQPPQA
jgi:hypothetical protein